MASPILWIVLAVLILTLYLWSATSYAKETVIIQTSLESFSPDLLNEKSPILIEDRIVDIDEFINASFKWVFITRFTANNSKKNKYSYLVIHANASNASNASNDITISTCRPGTTESVNILVPSNTILILPTGWSWSTVQGENETKSEQINVIGINTAFGCCCCCWSALSSILG